MTVVDVSGPGSNNNSIHTHTHTHNAHSTMHLCSCRHITTRGQRSRPRLLDCDPPHRKSLPFSLVLFTLVNVSRQGLVSHRVHLYSIQRCRGTVHHKDLIGVQLIHRRDWRRVKGSKFIERPSGLELCICIRIMRTAWFDCLQECCCMRWVMASFRARPVPAQPRVSPRECLSATRATEVTFGNSNLPL